MRWWCDGKASDHRLQLHGVVLQVLARILQPGDTSLTIEHPVAVEVWLILRPLDVRRIQRRRGNATAANRRVAIQSHLGERHDQRVAGKRALYVERTSLRIAAKRPANALAIGTAGIDCPR